MQEIEVIDADDVFQKVKRTALNHIADAIRVDGSDVHVYDEIHMAVDHHANEWSRHDAVEIINEAPVDYGRLDQGVIDTSTLDRNLTTAAFEALREWLSQDETIRSIRDRLEDDSDDEVIKILIKSAVSDYGADDFDKDDEGDD